MNVAEWITAGGEVLIAVVIFWEMEENRRDRFLTEAADMKNYKTRGRVYSAIYDIEGESIGDRSKILCGRIWKPQMDEDEKLRRSCEQQIVLFNRLGQILSRAWVYRADYVKLFPHAVIFFWIILEPYVRERREMTGEWWACDFEHLTKECLLFVLKNPNARIGLYDRDRVRKKDVFIQTDELRRLEKRLRDMRGKLRRVLAYLASSWHNLRHRET